MTEISNKNLISRTLVTRMISCIEEYEAIKEKRSKNFTSVMEFCKFHKFSHQNSPHASFTNNLYCSLKYS